MEGDWGLNVGIGSSMGAGCCSLEVLTLPIIDGHGAAQEIDNENLSESKSSHFVSHGFLTGVMAQGLENVSVGGCVAAKNPPQQRNRQSQVAEVNRPPQAIGRFAKFQDHQASARAQQPSHLFEPGAPIGEVAQAVAHGDDVESGAL